MIRISSLARTVSVFVICATLIGCGAAGSGRVLVSGRVQFEGKDVEVGQIRFIPVKGSKGPLTVARIENGKYDTKDTQGIPVGTLRVEILGYDGQVYATAPRGPGIPPVPQLIPQKYNRQSELELVVESQPATIEKDFMLDPK
jgi:hypothetical protein